MNTPSTTSNRPAKPVKRSRLLLLLTLVALLGFAVGVWLGMSRSAICRANYERLTPGMTLSEVEDILGGPARDETTGPIFRPPHTGKFFDVEATLEDDRTSYRRHWFSNNTVISIEFAPDWTASEMTCDDAAVEQQTFGQTVRRWIRR